MDEKKYKEYLKYLEEGKSKKEIGIIFGYGYLKRPDMKLSKEIEEYKKSYNTDHTTKKDKEIQVVEENAIPLVTQNFFNKEENINVLIELVEEFKNKRNTKSSEIEIINIDIPAKYRGQKNEQKSIRVNNKIFKELLKTLKSNPNFKGMKQSDILNVVFLDLIEKYKS